jgi:uncharacterized protein
MHYRGFTVPLERIKRRQAIRDGVERMKIERETGVAQYLIRSYAPGTVKINDAVYTSSVVLTPEEVVPDWPPATFTDLASAHFDAIAARKPEVVILGTGARLKFPSAAVLAPLSRAGIGVEVMDTAAACRTYNILASDGRKVVAALLMIERDS